jgi:RHS repeat-associated protein
MKGSIIDKPSSSFRGALRTSRRSVVRVAIENMPIAPERPPEFSTNRAYGRPAEPQECGAGVGQSIYIGQPYDAATQLDYLNARYYNGAQGQFLSEDPTFLALGNPNGVQQLANHNQMALLANPQTLNAYSYSQDNPMINSDPSGNWYVDINFSFLIPLWQPVVGAGPTEGVEISQEGIYEYKGPAVGAKPGPGSSIGFSTANPTVGWTSGGSACLLVCYGRGSDGSTEWGLGTPGISGSAVYTKQLISFGPATYYIKGNQTQALSLQNANPVTSLRATNAITTNSGSVTSLGYNSSSGSGGSQSDQQAQNIQSQINIIESEIQTIQREINSS